MKVMGSGGIRAVSGRRRSASLLLIAAVVLGTGGLSLATASTASAGNTPIKIAFICSCSGEAGPEYQGAQGAFKARIDEANAAGGVNGHKITTMIIDDQTSPSLDVTAVQEAVSKGATGIVAVSALFFEGAKYANQAGLPVTGSSSDGPEWGTQPYTNMFASDTGSLDPKYPVNTQLGNFLVAHGGKVIGAYGYGISPSSSRSATGTVASVVHAGGKKGVLDTSIPFGSVALTNQALTAKAAGVNAVYAGMDDNSNFALATAMKQAGVKVKALVFPTGYEPSAVTSSAWSTLQGDYFDSGFHPFQLPNASTEAMQAALIKYDHYTKARFPAFDEYEAWNGADLMIDGLKAAGSHATSPAAVVKALRGIKSYNAGGLLPNPINYSTIFGHDLPHSCGWFLKAEAKGFVPSSSQPVCGTDLPGTTTVNS
jgi:ABC-type branched-subunit amino acid transport system substrate-binding protein